MPTSRYPKILIRLLPHCACIVIVIIIVVVVIIIYIITTTTISSSSIIAVNALICISLIQTLKLLTIG